MEIRIIGYIFTGDTVVIKIDRSLYLVTITGDLE